MGGINKPGKPTSKRTPTRLRHKIQKSSAAKQRKQRKLAKKNPEWRSKLKKDPGIPNLFPYKDKILQQIEETRARKAEEAQRKKDLARGILKNTDAAEAEDDGDEDVMDAEDDVEIGSDDDDAMDEDGEENDDSNPMAALLASAKAQEQVYKSQLQDSDDEDAMSQTSDIEVKGAAQSRRAYDKVFKNVVEQADVVLYVLDARDPEGTRSRDVERAVVASAAAGKRLILVLNKVDLIPPPVLKAWLAHLRRFFPTLPLRASNGAPGAHTFNHKDMTVQSTSAQLFSALKAYAAARNLKRAVAVGVIGYPNVGKSSVINALLSRLSAGGRQRTACPAGAEAGVTTAIRSVKIDSKLTLLDSPGIIFPSAPNASSKPKDAAEAHAHLVLLNAVPPKQIEDPVPAVTLLLRRLSRAKLVDRLAAVYNLPALLVNPETGDPTNDFLIQVARKRGRLGKGGVPNLNAAAMTVVTDWRDGRIQGWVDAPVITVAKEGEKKESKAGGEGEVDADGPNMVDQKEIVTEWAKEFKLDGLWGDDEGEAAAAEGEDAMQM